MISLLTLVAAEGGSEEESAIEIGHHIEYDVERHGRSTSTRSGRP